MAKLLATRLKGLERQLHFAERLARENGNHRRIQGAIEQTRKALIVLEFDVMAGRVPVTAADVPRCTEEQRRHTEYLQRMARRTIVTEALAEEYTDGTVSPYDEGDARAEQGGRE